MTKTISLIISDELYAILKTKSSGETIKQNKFVSMTDLILPDLIEKYQK